MSNPNDNQNEIALKNDHNVYILGAGFSREAGLPLIDDFLVHMRDSHEWLESEDRKTEAEAVAKVLNFRLRAASAAYYVNLDLENIEELFSLASASAGEMDREIRVAIAATIDFLRTTKPLEQRDMYVTDNLRTFNYFKPPMADQPTPKYPCWAKPAGPLQEAANYSNRIGPFDITWYGFHLARLLGLFQQETPKGQNTFITFNYDTVLEEALTELGVSARYIFGPGNIQGFSVKLEGPAIPVLKLHGSVNWGRKPSEPDSFAIYPSWSEMLDDKAEPLLVPPTWKKIFGGPLEAVWDTTVQRLSTATRIIIIGFSIPPNDMHFKYLLAAGLQNNVSLRNILFVNPDETEELAARAEGLLRKSYIDSNIIAFAKLSLSEFTLFQYSLLKDIGRPTQLGISADLFQQSKPT